LGHIALLCALAVVRGNVMDDIFTTNHMFTDENPSQQIDGEEMFEGDMILTPEKKMEIEAMRAGHAPLFDVRQGGKWPSKTVPYTFQSGFPYQTQVRQAIDVFERETCVRFKPRTNERFYIRFIRGQGCYAYIGMINRAAQTVSIGSGCQSIGIIIHELMHTIGFYHEQARRDRDSFIRINLNNVPASLHRQFAKYAPGEASTLNEPYDKQSVMHYGRYAFAINRNIPVITSLSNPNEQLGQRNGFSAIDLRQVRKHYQCDVTPPTQPPTRPPTQPPTKPPVTKCTKKGRTSRDKWAFCRRLDDFCKDHFVVRENCCRTCRYRAGIVPPN